MSRKRKSKSAVSYQIPDPESLGKLRMSYSIIYLIGAVVAFSAISLIQEDQLGVGMFELVLAIIIVAFGSIRLNEYKRYMKIIEFFQENTETSMNSLSLAVKGKEEQVKKDVQKLIDMEALQANLKDDRILLLRK